MNADAVLPPRDIPIEGKISFRHVWATPRKERWKVTNVFAVLVKQII